jgi:hypothetical protein
MAMVIGLIARQPLDYRIALGREDGPGSDLPFARGWNTPEMAGEIPYRWSTADSHVELAGLSPAPLALHLRLLPATANPHLSDGVMAVASRPMPLVALPLPRAQRELHLLVPPAALEDGRLDLHIHAPAWTPSNDPRTLGVPVSDLRLKQVSSGSPGTDGPAWLPVPLPMFWPLLLLPIAWVPLRRWGRHRAGALLAAVGVSALLLLALSADRLRFPLAAAPALLSVGWALGLALALRALSGRFARRLGVNPSPGLLDGLALLFFVLFALRYAGRLYPDAMVGDLGFHVNRENDVIRGNILLVSRHRGIDFPYPPALYLILLPFRLLPITPEALVEFADALFGALGLYPLAYVALCGFKRERVALPAAAAYALLAPAMMSLWWSFLPHIFAQELAVLILAGLIGGWAALSSRKGIMLVTAGLALLWTTHFGFYLNVSVLLALLGLLLFSSQGRGGSRFGRTLAQNSRGLVLAFGIAQALVLLLFYSAYVPLFLDKLRAFEAGGMGAVQGGRSATPWPALLRSLWRDGLVAHYATIGVPLGLLGGYRLWSSRAAPILKQLFAATLIVALVQGAIPFITSSTITTRWLSFAAWIVALGLGLLLDLLWRRGRGGRLVALLVLGWIGWNTLFMWAQALAYRVRPPEPF